MRVQRSCLSIINEVSIGMTVYFPDPSYNGRGVLSQAITEEAGSWVRRLGELNEMGVRWKKSLLILMSSWQEYARQFSLSRKQPCLPWRSWVSALRLNN